MPLAPSSLCSHLPGKVCLPARKVKGFFRWENTKFKIERTSKWFLKVFFIIFDMWMYVSLCTYIQYVNASGQRLWVPWSWSYMVVSPLRSVLESTLRSSMCALIPATFANVSHLQTTPYSSTIWAAESWPEHSLEPQARSFPAQASTAELRCPSPICSGLSSFSDRNWSLGWDSSGSWWRLQGGT